MITRITRLLILIQLAIAAGLAILALRFAFIDQPWHAALVGLLIVAVVRFAITMNNFFLAWTYRSETPQAMRLNSRQLCALIWREFSATMWSSSWSMPFQTFSMHIAVRSAGLPVLLVHGYGCNSGYWKAMSDALAHADITHKAINMEPVLGSIDAYAAIVHHEVDALCKETGAQKIVIVAHSMGGLAARAYLRDHGCERIARVITLGTPHHGTALANFSLGTNCGQMRWKHDGINGAPSAWLQQLQQSEDENKRALFVSIYSHHDNIIAPQTSSHLPGAKNIELHGIGHVALALSPEVQKIVIDEILLASQTAACSLTEDTQM